MVGFDAKHKIQFDSKYICSHCSLILRDPIQLTQCGHRLCQSCIDTQQQTTITCPLCQTQTPKHQMLADRGFRNDMQLLTIECSFCPWTGALHDYQQHIDQLHPNPLCHFCNQHFDSVNTLNHHQLALCNKVTIDCVLKQYGCNEQVNRNGKEEHYLTQQHQDVVIRLLRQVTSYSVDRPLNTNLPPTTTTDVTSQIPQVHEIVDILSGGIETLHDDEQRLSNDALRLHLQLQTLSENVSKLRLSIDESESFLGGVKHNQDLLSQDVSSVKEKIDDLQNVSYDGTFVWKISNVREKMGDARSERQTSIYSPPFYSSPTGYKMRLRLYLYGDGNARRTHWSLFFVLMRGLNDAILTFPFNHKVTFCLYDQSSQQRHIIDSFRPDIRSNSFQRPRSDMNIASGIPKFCPLELIEGEENGYVRDDTMFIKVMVDFGDMHKALLPYAFSLNPGFPTHVQQAMMKQEAERRVQQQQQQISIIQ